MISGKHSGEWFLPGLKKYPGRIIIDSKREKIQLEIYSAESLEGTPIKFPEHTPTHFHEIILGICSGPVTLFHCQLERSGEIATGLFKSIYRIDFAFSGIHFVDNKIMIRGGEFIYPHLSSWYDGHDFLDKLDGKEGLYVNGKHVIQNMLTTDEIKINDDLTLLLVDDVFKRIKELSISYEMRYEKYARFIYATDVTLRRLLEDAVLFQKLLSLCFGKPLNLFITSVQVDTKNIGSSIFPPFDNSNLKTIHVNNYSLKNKQKIESHGYHGRHLLLSGHTSTKEELNQVIVNWYRNVRFHNIYEYYLDSNKWFEDSKTKFSNIMFNNRFLNLIQGLEDYYREVFEKNSSTDSRRSAFDQKKAIVMAQIKSPELKDIKKWFNDTFSFKEYGKQIPLKDKLAKILNHVPADLSDLFHNIDISGFPQSAANFRNDLSHGLLKEMYQGPLLRINYFTAQILLGICILRTLEVSNISKKAAYYHRFVEAVMEILFENENIKSSSQNPQKEE